MNFDDGDLVKYMVNEFKPLEEEKTELLPSGRQTADNIREISPKPKKTSLDHSIDIAKVITAAVPAVGGAINEVFNLLGTPYSKRQEKWLESIYGGLLELREKFDYVNQEYLQQNKRFISGMAQASQIALRTHQDEKLLALQNAVLNTALKNSPDDDTQLIYLNLIDILTPSHLQLLKFIYAPEEWILKHKISINKSRTPLAIEVVFPDYRARKAFYRMVAYDLEKYNLISTEFSNINRIFTGYSVENKSHFGLLPIDWGRKFLKFIETPQSS